MLTVAFSDFWQGFEPRDFFVPVIEKAAGEKVRLVGPTEGPDIHVRSVFASKSRVERLLSAATTVLGLERFQARAPASASSPKTLSIWFTGENVRPPWGTFDLTLSFDGPDERNFRLPLWWLLFPISDGGRTAESSSRLGLVPSLHDALWGREPDVPGREKFACAFFGKYEPMRARLVDALGAISTVDVFGALAGRLVKKKSSVASKYNFVVCPENDLYPGYITEKAIEAWSCGAIPLYNGLDKFGDLNPNAMLNAADFDCYASFTNAVRDLIAEPSRMAEMRRQPILQRAPDLEGLANFLQRGLAARGLTARQD